MLRRFIIGRSDAAERRLVETWAAEKADRRRYLAAMRQLYEQSPPEARDEAARAWVGVASRLEPPRDGTTTPPYAAPWERVVHVDVRRRTPRVLGGAFMPRRRWPVGLAAAAALGVAVAGGTLLVREAPRFGSPTLGMRQIVTAKGQRTEFQLNDGSRVVLGVDSRLRFPAAFGAGSRELYLDGAAYFDVVHDVARPFRVHTSNAIAEDVGTRFVVTAYPNTRTTQVVVSQGAVALGASRSSPAARVVLTRGQLGRLALFDSVPEVRAVDPVLYGAWMHGEMVLRDAPLSEVVAELNRWYSGEVRLGDSSLTDVPITASFTEESLREAIDVVATIAPVRAQWHGRNVTLYRR